MDIGENYSHLYASNIKHKKRIFTDGLAAKKIKNDSVDILRAIAIDDRQKNTSALLLNGERVCSFVTRDFLQSLSFAENCVEQNIVFVDARGRFDSIHPRRQDHFVVGYAQDRRMDILVARSQDILADYRAALRISLSPMRMYQVSLTGAMVVGMVSMSLIYRNLGQSAFAQEAGDALEVADGKEIVRVIESSSEAKELVGADKKEETHAEEKESVEMVDNNKDVVQSEEKLQNEDSSAQNVTPVIMADIVQKDVPVDDVQNTEIKNEEKNSASVKSVDSVVQKDKLQVEEEISGKSLEELAYETVKGYPIEKMLPYILEQDPEVAKYLIAIAKQESQWGERVPVLNGQDCYNYWGYRGQRKLMGTGGHTCFNSREDAVKTVGKRLHTLIYENDRETANRLVVWKCGSTCSGHSQEGVDRWINVVKTYYDRLSRG